MATRAANTFSITQDVTESPGYQLEISAEPESPAWDAFLEKTPGGHHVQTGLWAQLKGAAGWKVVRIIAKNSSQQITAGGQLLVRKFRGLGKIGMVSKGPLISNNDPQLASLVIEALIRQAKINRIQFLIVQPPNNGEATAERLLEHRFQAAAMSIAPTATVMIDLHKELDEIQADMSQTTRRNIRISQRKGLTVREGTQADLEPFYATYLATSERKDFSTYPREYYERLWELFAPLGHARLAVAELEGQILSTQLSIPFGDTVINKMSTWTGEYGSHRPNEGLHWAVIEWAKAQGYHYYDLEGIDARVACAEEENEKAREEAKNTFTTFKLRMGGQVACFPGAYVFISNPLLRAIYRLVFPKTSQSPIVRKVLGYLRTN